MTDADGRGQVFTLESVAAALLLLGTLVFVTGAPGVGPLSSSTASQEVPEQRRGVAAGVLDVAVANGTVRPTLLYWNESAASFHGTDGADYYVDGGPPTAFGTLLDRTFAHPDAVYNVNVVYGDGHGEPRRRALVRRGTPSDDAVAATRTVTLYDGDALLDESGNRTNTTLAAATYFAPDAADGTVYNVVRVEVVVWPT